MDVWGMDGIFPGFGWHSGEIFSDIRGLEVNSGKVSHGFFPDCIHHFTPRVVLQFDV